MRPSDGVDDGAGLLHVAVFANRSVEVGGLEELLLGNTGNALDHLRRVARVLLLQELEYAVRVLQCGVEVDGSRQRRKGRRLPGLGGWRRGCFSARTLVVPACAVVGLFLGIETGEQAVDIRKLEVFI